MLLTIALYGNHRGRLIGLQAIVNQVWGWSLLHYTFVHKYSYLGNTIIFIFGSFAGKQKHAYLHCVESHESGRTNGLGQSYLAL